MKIIPRNCLVIILIVASATSVHAQTAPARTVKTHAAQTTVKCDVTAPGITVYGAVPKPFHLTMSELAAMPTAQTQQPNHDGKMITFDGVTLASLLERAGAPIGAALRGPALQTYVSIEAADGYSVVLALADADTAFRAETPVVAFNAEGAPLLKGDGPLQLIVPGDKRHGRWVHMVACVRVANAAPTKGAAPKGK